MGEKADPKRRIQTRSIGFETRQIEFFDKYPDFKPSNFCRAAIDEQIREIDPSFLEKNDNEKTD